MGTKTQQFETTVEETVLRPHVIAETEDGLMVDFAPAHTRVRFGEFHTFPSLVTVSRRGDKSWQKRSQVGKLTSPEVQEFLAKNIGKGRAAAATKAIQKHFPKQEA